MKANDIPSFEIDEETLKEFEAEAAASRMSLATYIFDYVNNAVQRALANRESRGRIEAAAIKHDEAFARIEANPGTHQFRAHLDEQRARKERRRDRLRRYEEWCVSHPEATGQERVEVGKRLKLVS